MWMLHDRHEEDTVVPHIANSRENASGKVLVGGNLILAGSDSNVSFVNPKSIKSRTCKRWFLMKQTILMLVKKSSAAD